MSVKLIDNAAFYGYRVRRSVAGKLHQEYFSLKIGGKRASNSVKKVVKEQAKKRDDVLAQQQALEKQRNKSQRCFRSDGSVKGVSFLNKREKSGNLTPIFQVGIASDLQGKVICTSFSIHAHGVEKAWQKTIATYAKHKNIPVGSKLYQQLLASMPAVALATGRPSHQAKPVKKA